MQNCNHFDVYKTIQALSSISQEHWRRKNTSERGVLVDSLDGGVQTMQ